MLHAFVPVVLVCGNHSYCRNRASQCVITYLTPGYQNWYIKAGSILKKSFRKLWHLSVFFLGLKGFVPSFNAENWEVKYSASILIQDVESQKGPHSRHFLGFWPWCCAGRACSSLAGRLLRAAVLFNQFHNVPAHDYLCKKCESTGECSMHDREITLPW